MKKKIVTALVFIIFPFFLMDTGVSTAVDGLGCLVCHQYPGLVKMERPDSFKVLHIDEGKHLNSPHGKVDCRQCHTPVVKIPHGGDTGVDCTSECHREDKEKIVSMKPSLPAFHNEEKFSITLLDDASSCRVCHPLYPHSSNIKMRAFLNMHTGYLLCEVCHLKKEKPENLAYDWKSPEHVEFSGGPFGAHDKNVAETSPESGGLILRMLRIFTERGKKAEEAREPEYVISRIAVFSSERGEMTLLMNTRDNQKAGDFTAKEKTLTPEERERELKFFHREIAKKEISVACNECHSPQGILDFNKLGFGEKRAKDLQYMNLKSLVTKYDVFYLPHLFGN